MRKVFTFLCSAAFIAPGAQAATDLPSASDGAIVVTGRLASTARLEQKNAPNLVNVQPAETIAKYPDVNAAEAISRIPGVSLSIDTAEGRFVNIRGLDGNLNGATFGGVVLLNTQPGGTYFNGAGRAVEFDTVPIGAIDRITVTKTGLPDREAEGLGGSIELTPRTAVGIDKPYANVTLGGGIEPLRGTGLYRDEVVVGAPLGHKDANGVAPFSFVLTQFLYNDYRAIDDLEAGYVDQAGVPNKAFDSLEMRRYSYNRRRFGYSGEFDIQPADGNRIYFRASVAGYNEHIIRNRLTLSNLGNVTTDPANPNGFIATGASATKSLRFEDETHRNEVFQVGGKHDLPHGIKIDWFAAYSRATYDKHYDYNSNFDGAQNLTIAYDNVTSSNYPSVNILNGGSAVRTQDYSLSGIGNQVERDQDREASYALNVSAPLHLLTEDELKFGVKLRYRHKTSYTQDGNYSGQGESLTGRSKGGPYSYYNGLYQIGAGLNGEALTSLYNGAGNALGAPVMAFDDNENVSAGYAQYQGHLGALGILAGVRVEHTEATYRGIASVTDTQGNVASSPASQSRSYTDVFPTLQLRYEVTPKLIARATYSTGIARPGFYQTTQSATVDVGAQTVSIGNPDLKPTYGHNFDVGLEYYLPDSGILSAGFFDKEFSNYIVARSAFSTTYPGLVGLRALINSYQNVSNAHARGVEASFVDRFNFLPGALKGLGVDANVTYVTSSVALRSGEASVPMPGTFKYSGNAAVFYEMGRAKLRLSGQYESQVLFGIGGSRATDVFQDKRFTLDLNGSYQLTSRIELYSNVKNLTNAPLRFYEGSANRPIQREFYDATIEGGVKLSF